MAKAVKREPTATSVKLDKNLKQQIRPYMVLREMSFTNLVEEALAEYIKNHPLTPPEKTFWDSEKSEKK
jgi:hypothetical protein